MRPIVSDHFDIFEIYHRYCDIKCLVSCRKDQESQKGDNFREALNQLLKLVESKLNSRLLVLEQISKLMSRLGFPKDSSEFTRFYEFVFFISRENGQKNISTTKAISCWKLILAGRFRLLKQWCDFVEKNQRHNISEDTWRQLLAFSRCVHENLDGYDPKGAWPVLIDDFVDHMYRTVGYRRDRISTCSCDDSIAQILEESLPGLRMFPGVKRKMNDDVEMNEVDLTDEFAGCTLVLPWKRRQVITEKQFYVSNDCLENTKNDKLLDSSKSPCAVDSCLSKGFAGLLTGDSCLQLESNKDLPNM